MVGKSSIFPIISHLSLIVVYSSLDHQDSVGKLFSSANEVNKAVGSLVEALTEDEQDSS